MDRREFLGAVRYPAALAGAALVAPSIGAGCAATLRAHGARDGTPEEISRDEDFWAPFQRAFTIDRTVVNLNNGGVSPAPAFVQDAMKRRLDFSNSTPPPVSLWRILEPQREPVRARVAAHWGCDAEEIAFTRNSSESLQICQLGVDLRPGDEVLATTLDYPRMLTTFRQRERRDGIRLVTIRLPIPCEDPGEVVRRYEAAITDRTRLILMSHIINITGQILPVREVVAMARARNGGIPVIVDGAHALAHFQFRIPDLGCDYYGVSLHKWLCAPHGTGLLYVRREKIAGLWPMMAAPKEMDANIRKFEEIGTHPAANALSIGEALTFHETIGDARKEARLRYLRDRWARRLLATGKVRLHTSLKPEFSCGIATFELEGVGPEKLAGHLWDKHGILTTAIIHDEFQGIRVTPSVYTTLEEIDRFCEAVEGVARDGLPPAA